MTQPDEPTVPSGPEKAHGDALEDAFDASAESSTDQPADDAETDQDG
jgi:hypothetical protein